METEVSTLTAIAQAGGLSPHTTSSRTWDSVWPLKPDVVMEGGNVGKGHAECCARPKPEFINNQPPSRRTAVYDHQCDQRRLCPMRSYGSSTDGRIIQICGPRRYARFIVHSAEWTEVMRQMYLPTAQAATKTDYVHLIRHCGWGVPDFNRALWSAGELTHFDR